ncbi:ABC-three component system protein [Sphingomonas sp. YL-JM2C]
MIGITGLQRSSIAKVDQRGASADGDIVARDKITHHHNERRSQIDGWLDRLADEMRDNAEARNLVENLQYYFQPFPYDDVVGLEAKLDRAGRTNQKRQALRKKEAFSKLLAEWQAYPSAQEIIAYFLTKLEACFEAHIVPDLDKASTEEIDSLISEKMIEPVLAEMGCGPFMLNYLNVSGMVYWLAEQCYIRWHA